MNCSVVRLTVILLAIGSPLFAQSQPAYIQFSPSPVKGALYKPDSGPAPHVAILIIHRTANVLGSPTARELASRGFMVLGVNPRSDNNEAAVNFEANALDIKSGVEFLSKQSGISTNAIPGSSIPRSTRSTPRTDTRTGHPAIPTSSNGSTSKRKPIG